MPQTSAGRVWRPSGGRDELPIDAQVAAKKVDSINGQPQRLALTEAGARSQHAGDPVPDRHSLQENADLFNTVWDHLV